MEPVTQEDLAGCGIACTAFVLKKTYSETKKLFDESLASFEGYYCEDIVKALALQGMKFSYIEYSGEKDIREGSIVFIGRDEKYPIGHYLVKTARGWMNPWINFPCITPAESGFQKEIPGKIEWVIYPLD